MAGRDLVMLDQRGTGASGLLRCPSIEGDESAGFSRAVARCARRLGARRSFYTSADSAEDVEALRIRLGVPRIALFAVSYGTRVAVEYARRHPDRLERLILDSPIAAEGLDPLARDTLGAVPRVLRRLCRSGCGGAEAHPVADMARLVTRLRRAPIRRTVRRGNRTVRITLDADDLLGLLVSGDLDPSFMRRIPPAVRAALRGNSRPLVRAHAARARRLRGAVECVQSRRCTSRQRARSLRPRGTRRGISMPAAPRRARRWLRRPPPRSRRSTAPPRCDSGCCRCAAAGRRRRASSRPRRRCRRPCPRSCCRASSTCARRRRAPARWRRRSTPGS